MTDVQRQQLDEAEGASPFLTRARPLRVVPVDSEPGLAWQLHVLENRVTMIGQVQAKRINDLEIEVAWLRRELETMKGEAQ